MVGDLDIHKLIRKIGFIPLCGKVGIGFQDVLQSHIESIQNLLVSRGGHNIVGL